MFFILPQELTMDIIWRGTVREICAVGATCRRLHAAVVLGRPDLLVFRDITSAATGPLEWMTSVGAHTVVLIGSPITMCAFAKVSRIIITGEIDLGDAVSISHIVLVDCVVKKMAITPAVKRLSCYNCDFSQSNITQTVGIAKYDVFNCVSPPDLAAAVVCTDNGQFIRRLPARMALKVFAESAEQLDKICPHQYRSGARIVIHTTILPTLCTYNRAVTYRDNARVVVEMRGPLMITIMKITQKRMRYQTSKFTTTANIAIGAK